VAPKALKAHKVLKAFKGQWARLDPKAFPERKDHKALRDYQAIKVSQVPRASKECKDAKVLSAR
jgi:hypothetical protein